MAEKQNVTREIRIDSNIEILRKYFPNCFDREGNFNLEKFKEEIKINEINLSKESYSLEWLGKSYARVLTFEPARTLLEEDEAWNNKEENKNSGNILIKGDNLEVLKHLAHAYYEKIKMIYIDPPYNTGNDGFVYQDDRKFTVEELAELAGIDEERAKRILDFVNSKSNSHSAWLTFMYPRLYIARRLLREDGVIFVSIDDNEVAQLKILMDEIFGEENFVAGLVHQKKSGGGQAKYYYKGHDYVLVYAKNKLNIVGLYKKDSKKLKTIRLEDGNLYWYDTDVVRRTHGRYNPQEGHRNVFYEDLDPCRKRKYEEAIKAKKYILIKDKETGKHFIAKYGLLGTKKKLLYSILNSDDDYRLWTSDGEKRIEDLFGVLEIFENPKPVDLIKIFLLNTEDDDIILDFFAGSGTTGDAVMQLNAEDGGNRKFILVQIAEPIDPNKNKIAYDFVKNELGEENPTIFHICKERLVRAGKKIKEEVINKKIEEKEKEIRQLESQLDVNGDNKGKIEKLEQEIKSLENQDLGFKIFETIPMWEDYLVDEKELSEQTTLFDASKLTDKDLKALLLTWKTYDGLPLTENCKEVKLNDYIAYRCGRNLYLLHSNWKTENIKTLLERIDSDEDFVVDKIIVFGYNFASKHLREIEENVRNYSNKKQIEIETIIRF